MRSLARWESLRTRLGGRLGVEQGCVGYVFVFRLTCGLFREHSIVYIIMMVHP